MMLMEDIWAFRCLKFVFVLAVSKIFRWYILLAQNGLVDANVKLRYHILIVNLLLSLLQSRFLIALRCRAQKTTVSAWSRNVFLARAIKELRIKTLFEAAAVFLGACHADLLFILAASHLRWCIFRSSLHLYIFLKFTLLLCLRYIFIGRFNFRIRVALKLWSLLA